MADISIRASDGAKAQDNKPNPPKLTAVDGEQPVSSEPEADTLVVSHEHLMEGVDPRLCGCRHLVKEAIAAVHKYPRAILEHPCKGGIARRVIKQGGFSCPPYYVDEANNPIPEPEKS